MKPPKDDPMMTLPVTKSVSQHPASPTCSLELIAPTNGGSKAKGKDKTLPGSIWDDVRATVLKAHEAISVDEVLMAQGICWKLMLLKYCKSSWMIFGYFCILSSFAA